MPVKEKKTSRAEFAYDTLKRRILDNQLPPGAMLSEVALAQKLNMSRTPIREALKMLMRDDLVEIRDGVGTFVKSATQKDIEDAYAVRQALEVLAARTAIGAFSSEELDALEARFRSLQVRLEQGETVRVEEFADADWALHDQILQKSGNRYAQKATNDLRAVLRRYQYLSVRLLSRVEESLTATGMISYRAHSPNKLSGGQKQRVAIAGVMAMQPECIVLDEPTAMLDPNGRKEVLRAVRKLNEEKGVTVILITHYMEEVVFADRVFVMDNGKLVMQGTPREIFSEVEKLKELRLDVPQVTLLAYELRKNGVDLPEGILTIEELVNALCH